MRVASGLIRTMNALPLKPNTSPAQIIDDLIADHGPRRVILAVLARLLRRSRPVKDTGQPSRADLTDIDTLPDYLRRDIGLPPRATPSAQNAALITHMRNGL